MQKAIEVLESEVKSYAENLKIAYSEYRVNPDYVSKEIDRMIIERGQIQTAINHLKRKVKKDPRVDGLPEANKFGSDAYFILSNELIIWKKDSLFPFMGFYCLTNDLWHDIKLKRKTTPIPTDEILFYTDPNEIV